MNSYVTMDKRSKKQQREYYSAQRHTWGQVNQVTRTMKCVKTYDRNREKKELQRQLEM